MAEFEPGEIRQHYDNDTPRSGMAIAWLAVALSGGLIGYLAGLLTGWAIWR